MTTCSICGQQVPVDDLDEHMRIELLDPKWKTQRDILEGRKAQASELQGGANVVSSLKNLARNRVDIFGGEKDEERRKRQEEEEREKRKEKEKVVWDGHTASKENTLNKYQTNVNFDEQIAAIHRAKGLGPYVYFPNHTISTLTFGLQARSGHHWSRYWTCSCPFTYGRVTAGTIFTSCTTSSVRLGVLLSSNRVFWPAACVNVPWPTSACYAAASALSRYGCGAAIWLPACPPG